MGTLNWILTLVGVSAVLYKYFIAYS